MITIADSLLTWAVRYFKLFAYMEITINNEVLQFNFGNWWGPMYIYENIMDIEHHPERAFNPVKTVHLHVMLYSILLNDNPDMALSLEGFLKAIENLQLYKTILDHFNKRMAVIMDSATADAGDGTESKKKKSRQKRPTSA